jgi:hypothetical protein
MSSASAASTASTASLSKDEKKPLKIKRPITKRVTPHVVGYTREEVDKMSDDELLRCFIEVKGVDHLHCSHCKRETPIALKWVYSIRKRSSKHGLYCDTPNPKTCDVQQKKNETHNPINNTFYNTVRRTNVSDSTKHILLQSRLIGMNEIGVSTNPRIYLI